MLFRSKRKLKQLDIYIAQPKTTPLHIRIEVEQNDSIDTIKYRILCYTGIPFEEQTLQSGSNLKEMRLKLNNEMQIRMRINNENRYIKVE